MWPEAEVRTVPRNDPVEVVMLGLRLMVEILFVERLFVEKRFTDGQQLVRQCVKITKSKVYKVLY